MQFELNSPLSPPIKSSNTYKQPPSGDYGDGGCMYSFLNPTQKILEEMVGRLEMKFTDEDNDVNALSLSCSYNEIVPI